MMICWCAFVFMLVVLHEYAFAKFLNLRLENSLKKPSNILQKINFN